ncbi:hypothetical protein [Rhodococcoides kyotonense]|uniref:Uncharacterized protein n=1 Tax=Rhodococcoides kyotonense TaxID=398843 RepID=A0A239EKA3_9NOCA|nr:hypothetical protein [Rhodococcus kyotonensis]SNS44294.1 hypothetical protein SAMN05421642_102399 [Rhodococcus kyotonensis]
MKSFATAVVLTVMLTTALSPLAAAQPAAGVGCVDVVTTTTPVPTPVIETTDPPIPCEPVATESPSTAAVPTTAVPTTAVPSTTPPTTAAPTTAVPTTAVPAATTTSQVPTVPVSTLPAPTTPVPTVPSPTPAVRAAAPVAAAADLLDIVVPSAMTGPATITPGTTWTGTMSMNVLGVGTGGWKSNVSLSAIRGNTTGRVITPTSATYSAPSSVCTLGVAGTSPAASVALTSTPVLAKSGGALCLTSWTSTVSIGIPSTNVIADTYRATLTHSVY